MPLRPLERASSHGCMDSVARPDRPAQRRQSRPRRARNEPNAAVMAAKPGGTGFEIRETNPEPAKMAATGGGWEPAAATKQSQRPSLRTGSPRNEPTGSAERSEIARTNPRSQRRDTWTRETKPRSSGWKGLHQSDESHHRHAAKGGASRQNKATIIGEEGIAPIGGILPTSGGSFRVARGGRRSVHRVGGIGATCAQATPPHRMAMVEHGARGRE